MSNLILNSVQFPGLDDIYINPNTIRPNLLRNWYFVGGGTGRAVFPVNQRKQTVYTTQEYCIDGWQFFPYSEGTLTLEASYITLVKNDATQNPGMHQYFDGIQDGNVVTISILSTDGLASVTSEPLSSQIGSSWQVSQQLFNSKIWCGLRFISGHWNMSFTTTGASVIAVKVEIGIQQTLAHQEDNSWVLNEIPDYETELLKCQTSTTDTSDLYANKILGVNVSNENLIDNWYFIGSGTSNNFPINQRGQTSYTVAGYCIDRWNSQRTTHTLTTLSNFIRWERITTGYNPLFYQPVTVYPGEAYTFSMVYRSTFRKLRDTFSSTQIPEASDWTLYTATRTVTAGQYTQNAGVQDLSTADSLDDTGRYIDIKAIKLEKGSQQTLAHLEHGAWVINEIPNYSEELYKCLTADDAADGYADWKTVVGKLNANSKPYLRFYGDENTAHQFVVLASGNFGVQSYNGTSWSTVAEYSPADRFVTMLSDYVTLSSQTWTTWSGGNVYGIPISFTSMPSGYHIISATLYNFANWPSGGSFEAFANGTNLYALSTIAKANIGSCKLQYRVILEKD